MSVEIQVLRNPVAQVADILQRDGWSVQEQDQTLTCAHAAVTGQQEARKRLHKLGLLTSPFLRINFRT